MQTRKFPRTLNEAFGPYTSRQITEKPDPMPAEDKIIIVTCCIGIVAVVAMMVAGWI